MPTFFLLAPEGPLDVKRGGRDVSVARYPQDVATWSSLRGATAARAQVASMMTPGVTSAGVVVVQDTDGDRIRLAVVDAEARRTAGMAEATLLRAERAGARAALTMAPYTVELDGLTLHITVDAAQDRLARAEVAIAHAPPEVRRWL